MNILFHRSNQQAFKFLVLLTHKPLLKISSSRIIFFLTLFFISFVSQVYGESEPQFNQTDALNTLKSAAEKFDELDTVPDKAWFGTDKRKINQDINDILNEAIAILDIPELIKLRADYRKLESAVIVDQDRIAQLKEHRLFAPEGEPTITKFVPTKTVREWTAKTKGDYDSLITEYQESIQKYQDEMKNIEIEMSQLLSDIGIQLDPEQVEFWLSSVIGDDVLSMSVVFSNIKVVTIQLAELTRESGENLTYAKRYYGMLVMLHQLVVQMQEDFINKTDNVVLPKLAGFLGEADQNISEARRLLREGGNRISLESNIAANELTKQAIDLYQRMVIDHRNKVARALKISDRERRVSVNTYKTVRLSSDVRDLIREGLNTFETLQNLQIPAATEFQNNEIREEFRKLTERLKQE